MRLFASPAGGDSLGAGINKKMENIEPEILKKIDENNKKIDAVYASVERMRKYFLWSAIFNIVIFILPLIGLIFIIPWFLSAIDYVKMGL